MNTTQTATLAIADEHDIRATIPAPALRAILRIAAETLNGMDAEELDALDLTAEYREILLADTLRILEASTDAQRAEDARAEGPWEKVTETVQGAGDDAWVVTVFQEGWVCAHVWLYRPESDTRVCEVCGEER